eukprot:3901-Heterococcus_DN1.PRE.3
MRVGSHILADLYRNQGIEQLVALEDLLAYLLQEKDSGAALQPDDVSDMKECAVLALEAIDAFLNRPRDTISRKKRVAAVQEHRQLRLYEARHTHTPLQLAIASVAASNLSVIICTAQCGVVLSSSVLSRWLLYSGDRGLCCRTSTQ